MTSVAELIYQMQHPPPPTPAAVLASKAKALPAWLQFVPRNPQGNNGSMPMGPLGNVLVEKSHSAQEALDALVAAGINPLDVFIVKGHPGNGLLADLVHGVTIIGSIAVAGAAFAGGIAGGLAGAQAAVAGVPSLSLLDNPVVGSLFDSATGLVPSAITDFVSGAGDVLGAVGESGVFGCSSCSSEPDASSLQLGLPITLKPMTSNLNGPAAAASPAPGVVDVSFNINPVIPLAIGAGLLWFFFLRKKRS